MAIQSYKKTFVSNSPTLLASGATVENLAVAQVGILDGNTYVATTTPTYAKNKALKFVWGTPDLSYLLTTSGVPNQNDYSKLVKGRAIKDFKGVKAQRGQQEIVTVGWSGDTADTDTLFAEPGEVKWVFVKLTGGPIDKKFSLQGVTRQYGISAGTTDDETIDNRVLADELVKQINADSYINSFVEAGALYNPSSTPGGADTDYEFLLRVCDTQDNAALGNVQAQYASDIVKRVATEGSKSVYQIIRDTNSLPTAFSTVDTTLIPDCDECPTGYTFTDYGYAYKVVRADAGSSGNLTTLKSDYSIASGTELGSRVLYEGGVSTYVIVSDVTISAAVNGTDVLEFLGDARAACVLTTPSTVGWVSGDTFTTYTKDWRITIADDHCGDDRLTDLQAAFPSLTVTLVTESSGDCVHTYETSTTSNRVSADCDVEEIKWPKPQAFEGIEWEEVEGTFDGTEYQVGVRIEAKFVPYVPDNDLTFGYFPANEQQAIHIQVSEFDPNYNNAPESTVSHWAVKKIQGFKQAIGSGAAVRVFEKESLSYELRERAFDPVVRQIENYEFQAQVGKYYDEYILEFDFSYKVGGWSEHYTDSYKLHVFFPEGQGKNFEAAVNGYVSSARIDIDPVVL